MALPMLLQYYQYHTGSGMAHHSCIPWHTIGLIIQGLDQLRTIGLIQSIAPDAPASLFSLGLLPEAPGPGSTGSIEDGLS